MAKNTVEVTDSSFQELVVKSDKPVLVDFWAEWCGPCQMIAPILEELAVEFKDRVTIAKMNVDECSETPMEFGIRNIPTLLFFKNGQVIDKQVGAVPKSALKAKIEAILT